MMTRTLTIFALLLWIGSVSAQESKKEDASLTESSDLQSQKLELQFEDDFEKGRTAWETTDDSNWKLMDRKNSGKVFGLLSRTSKYQPPVRSPHNIALIKGQQFENFVLEFDVCNVKDTGAHRDCCVYFGYQDPKNFYYVHLGHQPDAASGQIMIVDDKPRSPLTKNETKKIGWTDGWHKVKVIRNTTSGEIRVYFDDMSNPYLRCNDKTFGKGRIGLGSFDDINHFDNVKVYGR